MTKENLKKLIQEVYEEVVSEDTYEEVKSSKSKNQHKSAKTTKATKPAKPASEEPAGKITKSLLNKIDDREKANKAKGDHSDVDLLGRVSKMLKRHVGQTLEESQIEEILAELECDECWEEGAKPDFLDLDGDGNKTEPMKDAAKDAKKLKGDKAKEVKEILNKRNK